MSRYFAEVDPGNVVLRVIVCGDPDWPTQRLGGTWIETADPYTEAGDVAYTGPGHGYDPNWPGRFAPKWRQPVSTDLGWTWYDVGAVVFHGGFLWVSTMNENVWEPGVSAWRRAPTTPGVPPVWTQPTGSHDAWQAGEHVMCEGSEYRSLIDANVWSPTGYPAGWQLVA